MRSKSSLSKGILSARSTVHSSKRASSSSDELTLILYRYASLLLEKAASQTRKTSTSSMSSSSLIWLTGSISDLLLTFGLTRTKQAWFSLLGASLRFSNGSLAKALEICVCPMWYIFYINFDRLEAIWREIASIKTGCSPTTTPLWSTSLKVFNGWISSHMFLMLSSCQQDPWLCVSILKSNKGLTMLDFSVVCEQRIGLQLASLAWFPW